MVADRVRGVNRERSARPGEHRLLELRTKSNSRTAFVLEITLNWNE